MVRPITWRSVPIPGSNPASALGTASGAFSNAAAGFADYSQQLKDDAKLRREILTNQTIAERLQDGGQLSDLANLPEGVNAETLYDLINRDRAQEDIFAGTALNRQKTQVELDEQPERFDIFKRKSEAEILASEAGTAKSESGTRLDELNIDEIERLRGLDIQSKANVEALDKYSESKRRELHSDFLTQLQNNPNLSDADRQREATELTDRAIIDLMGGEHFRTQSNAQNIPLTDFFQSRIGQRILNAEKDRRTRANAAAEAATERQNLTIAGTAAAAQNNFSNYIMDPQSGLPIVAPSKEVLDNEKVSKGHGIRILEGHGNDPVTGKGGFSKKHLNDSNVKDAIEFLESRFPTRSIMLNLVDKATYTTFGGKKQINPKKLRRLVNQTSRALQESAAQRTNAQIFDDLNSPGAVPPYANPAL